MNRRLSALAFLVTLVAACGGPPRPNTHGFRAVLTVRDETTKVSYEIAVRGDDRRRQPVGADDQGPVLIVKGAEKKVYELDPKAKTYKELPFESLDAFLPGHPLGTGFSDRAEKERRGIDSYRRESDTVFGGNACQLYTFQDDPDNAESPSTTYWVTPALDMLVVRVDRETPRRNLEGLVKTTELTNVRALALPELFEIPKGYKKSG